ncbi:hypothetical protein MCANUFG4_01531 [Mycoplasmopsis canis UFG4]|uniref:Uncharacterized protein n=2 Tax=Mycoplasmopsis canis TaxID=29555 RepID=I1A5F7_9BACT|nr:hypothetical protein [Mycoplasmopsis canis]AKF41090.1 hypothetical protein AAW50_01400 [Mycoplasmopsis canis]AMD81205.1 hypothetical protein AXW82_01345 [Mycoplasmopsis canis PG 14]EIE39730.1 hypothetical protein MCANPG14_01591 [Mycoplasmopsis canis PG 14]EIE39945.1 hypothetical protein MCANUF31_01551 [Mycoplasmopsis canis UF31]EIE40161.1 hypothetical protein MCANUF33_01571 [Mycoplasmopsis canis UF33]
MNNTSAKEIFYRLAKEELAAQGITDPQAIEALFQKYQQEIKNVRDTNIKDDAAKKIEKNFEL